MADDCEKQQRQFTEVRDMVQQGVRQLTEVIQRSDPAVQAECIAEKVNMEGQIRFAEEQVRELGHHVLLLHLVLVSLWSHACTSSLDPPRPPVPPSVKTRRRLAQSYTDARSVLTLSPPRTLLNRSRCCESITTLRSARRLCAIPSFCV